MPYLVMADCLIERNKKPQRETGLAARSNIDWYSADMNLRRDPGNTCAKRNRDDSSGVAARCCRKALEFTTTTKTSYD